MARKPAPAFAPPPEEIDTGAPGGTASAPAEAAPADPAPPAERPLRPYGRKMRMPAPRNDRPPGQTPAFRIGRQHLGAWVPERAARQFKAIAMEEGMTIQDYFVQVLNREFARKGRPQIAE